MHIVPSWSKKHFHSNVKAQDGTDCEFQLTPTGINVVKNNTKVSSFFWPRISRVDFKAGQRRLVITVDELVNFFCFFSSDVVAIFIVENQ